MVRAVCGTDAEASMLLVLEFICDSDKLERFYAKLQEIASSIPAPRMKWIRQKVSELQQKNKEE